MDQSKSQKNCYTVYFEIIFRGVYISGYSAGAHLIAAMFKDFIPNLPENKKKLIKATILCCGVFDLTPLVDTYINQPLNLTNDSAKLLSPMYDKIDKLNFIVYIVIGSNDSPAFLEQSKSYFAKIQNFGDVRFKILNELDHFSIVEKYNEEDYELVKFIIELNEMKK